MASVKLMLNKQRKLKDGTYPLVFQIIHCRTRRFVSTEYRIFQQQFDEISGKIEYCEESLLSVKEIKSANHVLKREYHKILAHICALSRKNISFSVDDIVMNIKKERVRFYLFQCVERQIVLKREMNKEGTAAAFSSTLSSLKKYVHEVFPGKQDVELSRIDSCFITGYENYLYKCGLVENTVNYYLRNFRTIYNFTIREGYKPEVEYPFIHIHTRPCRTVKRAIDKEQMKKLLSCSFGRKTEMEMSRDLYLFSFYAQGMAFVDIVFLKKENILGGIIKYSRHKSKQLIHVVITRQLRDLIEKYENDSEYVFPIIDTSLSTSAYEQYRLALGRINRHLKKMASLIGVEVTLTTYTARHTWATLARNTGAPISLISAGLGHTSEEMTRVYLKDFDLDALAHVNSLVTNLL